MPGLDCYRVEAKILEQLGPRLFRLVLPNGHEFLAYAPQRLQGDLAALRPGGMAWVELNSFDLSHARLVDASQQN